MEDNNREKTKSALKNSINKIDTNIEKKENCKPKLKKQVSISENSNINFLEEKNTIKIDNVQKKRKLSFKEQREKFEKRDSKLVKQLMNNPNMMNEILEKNYLKDE